MTPHTEEYGTQVATFTHAGHTYRATGDVTATSYPGAHDEEPCTEWAVDLESISHADGTEAPMNNDQLSLSATDALITQVTG